MSKPIFASLVRGSLLFVTGLVLASLSSCVTLFTDQDTLRGYPYQPLRTLADQEKLDDTGHSATSSLVIPGLAMTESNNGAFPDLYVFMEQSQSPELYRTLLAALPELLDPKDRGILAAVDKALLDRINQVLVFKPNGGLNLQGVLIGRFPTELLRAGLLMQKDWKQRLYITSNNQQVFCFENETMGMHVGLISDMFLVFQKDLKGTSSQNLTRFNTHVLRSLSFAKANFTPIVDNLYEKQPVAQADSAMVQLADGSDAPVFDPTAIPAELLNSSAKSFDQVLVTEKPRKALFALASVAMPASMPVAAVRVRIEPIKIKVLDEETAASSEQKLVDFQATLLPRPGMGAKALKTGIKFALMAFADMAGLDAAFLQQVALTEQDGVLVISGLQVSEASASTLLTQLVKLGGMATNGVELLKLDPAGSENVDAAAGVTP